MESSTKESVWRGLIKAWTDFSAEVDRTPLIDKLLRGKFRLEDYKALLIHHRQQVIEGGRWIALAAASIDHRWPELRSKFIEHAAREHRDFRMLEQDYVSLGGRLEEIQSAEKNIGSEALNAFMFYKAGQPNPFGLLGAMFIIEGLGQKKAGAWGRAVRDQLGLEDRNVSFLLYHGEHDEEHMAGLDAALSSGILEIPGMGREIVKTARVTARLYRLQIEEVGNPLDDL